MSTDEKQSAGEGEAPGLNMQDMMQTIRRMEEEVQRAQQEAQRAQQGWQEARRAQQEAKRAQQEAEMRAVVAEEHLKAKTPRHPHPTGHELPAPRSCQPASIDTSPSTIVNTAAHKIEFLANKVKNVAPYAHHVALQLVRLTETLKNAITGVKEEPEDIWSALSPAIPTELLGVTIPKLSEAFRDKLADARTVVLTWEDNPERIHRETHLSAVLAWYLDRALAASPRPGADVAVLHQVPIAEVAQTNGAKVRGTADIVIRLHTSEKNRVEFGHPVTFCDAKRKDLDEAKIESLAYAIVATMELNTPKPTTKVSSSRASRASSASSSSAPPAQDAEDGAALGEESAGKARFPVHVLFPFDQTGISLILAAQSDKCVAQTPIIEHASWASLGDVFVLFAVLHVATHALLVLKPEEPFFAYEPCPGAMAFPAITPQTKNLEPRHVFLLKRDDGKSYITKYIETAEHQIRPNVDLVRQVLGGEYLPGLNCEEVKKLAKGTPCALEHWFWIVEYEFLEPTSEVTVGHFRVLFKALAALHTKGYVHRDVRETNVVFLRGGVAKLIDFDFLARIGTKYFGTFRADLFERHPGAMPDQPATTEHDMHALSRIMLSYVPENLAEHNVAWKDVRDGVAKGEWVQSLDDSLPLLRLEFAM